MWPCATNNRHTETTLDGLRDLGSRVAERKTNIVVWIEAEQEIRRVGGQKYARACLYPLSGSCQECGLSFATEDT